MTPIDLEELIPDESVADLERKWGISRNALKARAKALGVELVRMGPNLTVWPGDRIAEADRLDAHLKKGGMMASFIEGSASRQPAVTPQDRTASSALSASAPKADQLALLAAAMASAMPQPAVDPLRRAKALADAADARLPLTNEDLEALVGHGIGWKDQHVQYGYRFHKRHQHKADGIKCNQVIWLVERDASLNFAPAAPAALEPAAAQHRGFAGLLEEMARPAAFLPPAGPAIDVPYRTVGERLFVTNRIG